MSKTTGDIIREYSNIPKIVLVTNVVIALIYITWWFNFANSGNTLLYVLLIIGEIYHVWQALGYIYTIWGQKAINYPEFYTTPPVDVFITVCGEPTSIVAKTIDAVKKMDYPNFTVYVLNDSKIAGKSNWKDIIALAKRKHVASITRSRPGGAKAGNINNALKITYSPLFVVFDADQVPEPDFLKKTVGYFADNKMALVQTPQHYDNKNDNFLTSAAWEQQELFFGPICRGKNRMNATFWCGTNAVLRRSALESIGGIPENSIAEDFLASLFMHEKGWKSVYVAEILANGLAPGDLQSYVKQQYRWARGSLEIIFRYNPIFNKHLTLGQKIQYLYSSSYYLNGFVALIDVLIPIIVLLSGINPVKTDTTSFIVYFFPFIFTTIFLLAQSSHNAITFKAIQLSISNSFIFIKAAFNALFGVKAKFEVTSKVYDQGNYLKYAVPHILYVSVGAYSSIYGLVTKGLVPSVITNVSWVLFNASFFTAYIRAAYPWETLLNTPSESGNEALIEQSFSIADEAIKLQQAPLYETDK